MSETLTKEEIAADPRLSKITACLDELFALCKEEPVASIILCLHVPATNEEAPNASLSLYIGEPEIQVVQLNNLLERSNDFKSDLTALLAYQVNQTMTKHSTTGDPLADQLFAKLKDTDLPN